MAFEALKIEFLRQAALTRLRAAVAAAVAPSPFVGLYVPKHRFEKLDPKNAPFVHVVGISDGGPGNSRQYPYINSIGELHINLLCACGRQAAADLDDQAWTLAEAICLLLLEDSSFLELFESVRDFKVNAEDGIARGDDGSGEYDVVALQIALQLADGPIQFVPRVPDNAAPLDTVRVSAQLGDPAESIPAQSLVVSAVIPIDQN